MQGEVYSLGRRRKGSIREQSRERERTDSDENRHRSHGNMLLEREEESARESEGNNREQTRKRQAKQTGVTDGKTYIIDREVLWTYFDARRGIPIRQRKKRQYQGAKQKARTDGLKRDSA
jgi:hypothetical protein